jgi:hypothetical protein
MELAKSDILPGTYLRPTKVRVGGNEPCRGFESRWASWSTTWMEKLSLVRDTTVLARVVIEWIGFGLRTAQTVLQ